MAQKMYSLYYYMNKTYIAFKTTPLFGPDALFTAFRSTCSKYPFPSELSYPKGRVRRVFGNWTALPICSGLQLGHIHEAGSRIPTEKAGGAVSCIPDPRPC